jgi:hypothetical protein
MATAGVNTNKGLLEIRLRLTKSPVTDTDEIRAVDYWPVTPQMVLPIEEFEAPVNVLRMFATHEAVETGKGVSLPRPMMRHDLLIIKLRHVMQPTTLLLVDVKRDANLIPPGAYLVIDKSEITPWAMLRLPTEFTLR